MGHRGEVSSVRFDVPDDKLTYFFNFKLNRNSDLFLNFVVSIKQEQGMHRPFRRHGVVVFEDQLAIFYQKMRECLESLRNRTSYQVSFQTESGRVYQIFSRQRGGGAQLVCKETNRNSSGFGEDMVSVSGRLAYEFEKALEKSQQEWLRLRRQSGNWKYRIDTSGMEKVKVRRVVKDGGRANIPQVNEAGDSPISGDESV